MSDGAAGIGGLSGLAGASGVPGGPHRGWIFAVIGGVLPVALLAAMVAVPAALWSRLPARVADHWTFTGTANGSSPRLVAFAALGCPAVLGACLVGLGWAVTRNGARTGEYRRGRAAGVPAAGLVSIGLFLMAISAASVIMVAVANLGGRGLGSASAGPGGLIGIVGGPALLAFSAGYGLRRHGGGTADSGRRGRAWGCGPANGPPGPGGRAPAGRGRPRCCCWPAACSPAP
jgi:hypothetical protein